MFDMMPFTKSVMAPFFDMDSLTRGFFGKDELRSFRTDIQESDNAYRLEAELPGFAKEDISVDVKEDRLTIEAHHASENDEKDKNGSYLRRERYFGSYSRCFDISAIDADNITASYSDGILTLEMPKKTAQLPTSRRLQIQ